MQSVYSTVPADWATKFWRDFFSLKSWLVYAAIYGYQKTLYAGCVSCYTSIHRCHIRHIRDTWQSKLKNTNITKRCWKKCNHSKFRILKDKKKKRSVMVGKICEFFFYVELNQTSIMLWFGFHYLMACQPSLVTLWQSHPRRRIANIQFNA